MTASLPLIARIAGLPAGIMASFGSDQWDGLIRRHRTLEGEIRTKRSELAEHLHTAIPASQPEHRRLLLDLKRDGFNGRSLQGYERKAPWLQTLEPIATLLVEILRLEARIGESEAEIEATFRRQRDCERRHLASLAGDLHFLRGIALSSLAVVENAGRLLRTPPEAYGRRERRLAVSLLRYASRSALKLSPFSTLTRVGLAVACPESSGAPGLDLPGWGSWRERSRVCLRRFLLDQSSEYLARHRPFRESLRIVLNDTAERFPDDRYRFLRTGYWDYDAETKEIRHHMPALVKVRLAGPLIEWLGRNSEAPERTYHQLLDEARKAFPGDSPQKLQATIDKLLEIGFLRFVWPWSPDDLDLERRVLEHCQALDSALGLEPFVEILRRVIDLLDSYSTTEQAAAVVAEARTEVENLVRTAAAIGGIEGVETKIKGTTGYYFQEDVFLHPAAHSGEEGAVVRLSQDRTREILSNIDPLVRISNLDNRRYEFLHTLAAFASARWPDQPEVGFVELFDASHKLFQEYIRSEIEARKYPRLFAPAFNPLGLEVIERVHSQRRQIAERFRDHIEPDGDTLRLDRDAFGALLDEVPWPYAASRDFCAFVQPLDPTGDQWVLNGLFEGAGRLSSRYTLVMDEPTRATWVSFFQERSRFRQDGEDVELVDMLFPSGHTLNVHAVQTQRVLEIPGESSTLPEVRRLRLRDLRVRLCGPDRHPELTDTSGRRLLPVHLGGLVFRFMPHLLKFLITFGPGEFHYSAPRRQARTEGDIRVMDRHSIGNVVFARKNWTFETAPLRSMLQNLSETAAFLAIQEWRQERGIPDRTFLEAPLSRQIENPQTKPQYIDFTSPMFIELFRSNLETVLPRLTMMEVLPGPERFPRDREGNAWAVELQLDSFGFSPFTGSVPPHEAGNVQ